MLKTIKLLFALLILPIVFFTLAETFGAVWDIVKDFQTTVGLLAGAALYVVVHASGRHFDRMYVWGHETTHALAAMLCGFRVHSMTVNKTGGHVKMDRCNAFVALAPYIAPFYALVAGIIYLGMSLTFDASAYRPVFVFVVGFFMAFHFIQTLKTLWEADQPDLVMAGGRIFSWVMIIFCNAVMLCVVLKCLFPEEVFLLEMARGVLTSSYNLWKIVINYIMDLLAQTVQ